MPDNAGLTYREMCRQAEVDRANNRAATVEGELLLELATQTNITDKFHGSAPADLVVELRKQAERVARKCRELTTARYICDLYAKEDARKAENDRVMDRVHQRLGYPHTVQSLKEDYPDIFAEGVDDNTD